MADVTWGVKVPEELKEQIVRLMEESGLRGRDFMQEVINAYIVENTKEERPEIAEDLKELQSLTQRINDIYLNMGHRIENLCKGQKMEMNKLLRAKDEKLDALQEALKESSDKYEKLLELYNDKNATINGLNSSISKLTDNNESLKALNKEYLAKIESLDDKLKEQTNILTQNQELKSQKARIDQQNSELMAKMDSQSRQVDELKKKLESVKEEHKKEVERLKESFDISREKLALSIEKTHIEELDAIKEEYALRIEQEERKREDIKELYEARLGELMNTYNNLSMQILDVEDREQTKKGD